MSKTLRIGLTFIIPAIIVFLFWAIAASNFFVMIGMGIPSGIGTGILFSMIDYYFIDKCIGNKFLMRFFVFLGVFVLVTIIHLLLEDGEISFENLF